MEKENNRIGESECRQASDSGQDKSCANAVFNPCEDSAFANDNPCGDSADGNNSLDGGSANAAGGAVRDINSKRIFEDPVLCAQFLRDYVSVEEVKHVRPDDIQNVSTLYHPFLGTEFRSDTVNRIRLHDENGNEKEEPLYLVSLIEHKSDVDYDVTMQILKYMVCIWHEYAKEQDRKNKDISKRKYFRYPPILPIVYYEGKDRWTADMHLRDRIWNGTVFGSYIPDFVYEVVRSHAYTNEELLKKEDEISLIMMISKIQDEIDLREFLQSPKDEVDRILKNSTPSIRRIIRDTLFSLLMKINVPVEEANRYAESVEECRMGYLFANMEKMDIQAERQNTAQARQEAETAKQEAETAKQKANAAEQKANAAKQKANAAEQKANAAEQKANAAEQKANAAEQKANAAEQKAEHKLIAVIQHHLAKGRTAEQIAEDLLEPTDYIRELMSRIPQTDQ